MTQTHLTFSRPSFHAWASPMTVLLFMAALVMSANVVIPLQPVPFSFQLFVVLTGSFLLAPAAAMIVSGVYVVLALLLGQPMAAGNPAFTGGYLVGYFVATAMVTLAWHNYQPQSSLARTMLALVLAIGGAAVVHLLGLGGLHHAMLSINPQQTGMATLAVGTLPFVWFDLGKAVLAALLAVGVNSSFRR